MSDTFTSFVRAICAIASSVVSHTGVAKNAKGKLSRACALLATNEIVNNHKVIVKTFDDYESLSVSERSVVKSTLSQARGCAKHAFSNHRDAFNAWMIGECIQIEKIIRGETHHVPLTISIYRSTFMTEKDVVESAFNTLLKHLPSYVGEDGEGNEMNSAEVFREFVVRMEIALSGSGAKGVEESIDKYANVK